MNTQETAIIKTQQEDLNKLELPAGYIVKKEPSLDSIVKKHLSEIEALKSEQGDLPTDEEVLECAKAGEVHHYFRTAAEVKRLLQEVDSIVNSNS